MLPVAIPLLFAASLPFNPHKMGWTSSEVTPWPLPEWFSNGTSALVISRVVIQGPDGWPQGGLLDRAIARYSDIIVNASAHSPVVLPASAAIGNVHLAIAVADPSEALGQETDESYTLVLGVDGRCNATAKTVFGAVRALESFAQLFETTSGRRALGGALTAPAQLQLRGLPWTIKDRPRFAHRGILIDSARHFLPLDVIRQHIDAMAMAKINLLHWHLVDYQSFPFASAAAPALVHGAYSPGQTYSPAELKEMVAYAKDRAVRVMVEVDTPGHSGSWGVGYPGVVTDCPDVMAVTPSAASLDPSNNQTFKVVERLLAELAVIFPDTTFHLGGDEVHFQCWNNSARVVAFMHAEGMVNRSTGALDFPQLEQYYAERLLAIAARVMPNRTLMMYQEVFDNGIALPDKIVFGVWKSKPHTGEPTNNKAVPEEVAMIAKAGHQVVLANGNNGEWYLNDGFGNGATVASWDKVYQLDPLNGTDHLLTPAQARNVIGGEVSLWGEEIDQNNLIAKAWPRSAAFGERMWSNRANTTVVQVPLAASRLTRLHCKMQARGITSAPISPGSCYQVQ